MKHFAAALLAMCAVSVPALGEESPKQTVENAHRFLETIAQNQGFGVEIKTGEGRYNIGTWSGMYNRERDISGYYSMRPFHAAKATGHRCDTLFSWETDWNAPLMDDTYGDLRQGSSRGAIATQISGLKDEDSLLIDWTRVPGVKRAEHSTQIEILGFGRVTLPTPELATRVQYAMEFLRNACDPTAATGF